MLASAVRYAKCSTVLEYGGGERGGGGVTANAGTQLKAKERERCYFESYFFVPVNVYTDALCPRTSTIGTRVVFPTFVQLSIPQILLHMMRVVCCST